MNRDAQFKHEGRQQGILQAEAQVGTSSEGTELDGSGVRETYTVGSHPCKKGEEEDNMLISESALPYRPAYLLEITASFLSGPPRKRRR